MRPQGVVTRGTTNPNRLRRVDNWIVATCGDRLRAAADPLVVDLGYGATPVTAVELRARLATGVRADVRVVGLEIDPVRVAAAAPAADPPGLTFARGGFELAGLRPSWYARSTSCASTTRARLPPPGVRSPTGSPRAGR